MTDVQALTRRALLLSWLRHRDDLSSAARGEWTTQQILDGTEIYTGNGRWDKAHSDLKALARRGLVIRSGRRPARWRAV